MRHFILFCKGHYTGEKLTESLAISGRFQLSVNDLLAIFNTDSYRKIFEVSL